MLSDPAGLDPEAELELDAGAESELPEPDMAAESDELGALDALDELSVVSDAAGTVCDGLSAALPVLQALSAISTDALSAAMIGTFREPMGGRPFSWTTESHPPRGGRWNGFQSF